jgi:hypothetical protein
VPHWRIKGAVQKVLERLPYGEQLHHHLQRRGGLASFADECDLKVDDWRIMMEHLRQTKISVAGKTLVEIGTGWYPTLPTCMYLAGAARIHTFDLVRHVRADLTRQLVDHLRVHVELIARAAAVDAATIETRRAAFAKRLAAGASLADASEGAIDYHAPADASRTGFPAGSVDLVFSNSVLEHVFPEVLPAMFAEGYRILKPGAAAMHSVNCGDHYAYFDRSISQLHYLKYSERAWKLWNNDFQFQNRLRAKEFTKLAKSAGFAIELDASVVRPQRLAELDEIRVDPQFSAYTREELSITNIDFVARKPG